MHFTRFIVIGGLGGAILPMTAGWLITGVIFHRFQRSTPHTWRAESWRNHAAAVFWGIVAGIAAACIFEKVGLLQADWMNSLSLPLLLWLGLALPIIATLATYVNLHLGVVVGLALEWLVFLVGIWAGCRWWAT